MEPVHDVIIIGGGQAGLASSHHLSQHGIDHVVLEAGPAPGAFWRGLWDSFTLVTTNFMLNLPGAEYSGPEPEGHLTREEVVDYLSRYAEGKPVRYDTRVTEVSPASDGRFRITTNQGVLESGQVIIATGAYQNPKIPAYARDLPADVLQIPGESYRTPNALPDGAVLVAGSGQTGTQLAEELYQAGRKVYLSVGRAARLPRYHRGRDITWWLNKVGFFDATVDMLPNPQARFMANPMLSGKDGGHELNLHQFARDGVSLLGHISGFEGSRLQIAPDLHENLRRTDEFERDKLAELNRWIESNLPDAPPADERPLRREGYEVPLVDTLDLHSCGVGTVIWACGYHNNYAFLKFPVLDAAGWPLHTRGVTAVSGLYFVGLPYLYKRKSSILLGVGEDAAYLAEQIHARIHSRVHQAGQSQ